MTNPILRRTLNAPCLLIVLLAILACSFAVPGAATRATADQADPPASFEQLVNDTLNLRASEVVTLDIDLTPGIERSIVVTIEGEDYTLNLTPHSVRAESYHVLMEYHDGELVEFDPLPVRTVRGSLAGLPDSIIAGSVLDDGLHVIIKLDEENTYWIEPLGDRVAGAAEGEHVVYHADDVIPSGGKCGNDAADVLDHSDANEGTRQALGHGTCGETELGCDADEEYLNAHGGSVAGVVNRVEFVINIVNIQYESQVGITHVITAVLIHTNPPGTLPGSGTEGENTYPYTSSSPGTLLDQFRIHWNSTHGGIPHDVAHLFTGKNLTGGIIGIANCIGCICSSSAFALSQSDCCGSNACSTDLTAHELGHVWGGFHCNCPCCTMNTPLQCVNTFSAGSISSITNHRNSSHCLSCPESGTTTLPFFDDFPTTTIDPDLWTGIDGAAANNSGDGEPSTLFSLNLDSSDEIRSAIMDTSGSDLLVV
ncbi:MAG: M12 family metallo-peptidase, partial [Planctomycetota bacterium]|nr:M12 family metallo-peptidase [Planctomycetota bacterium]